MTKHDRMPVEQAAINALITAHDELERQIDVAIDAYGEEHPIVDRLVMARDLLHLDITDLRHRRTPRAPARPEPEVSRWRAAPIFVIVGSTGEYSDSAQWPVRAFDTEAAAIDYRSRLLDFVRARHASMDAPRITYAERDALCRDLRAELDPLCPHVDHTGIDYAIHVVPLCAKEAADRSTRDYPKRAIDVLADRIRRVGRQLLRCGCFESCACRPAERADEIGGAR